MSIIATSAITPSGETVLASVAATPPIGAAGVLRSPPHEPLFSEPHRLVRSTVPPGCRLI